MTKVMPGKAASAGPGPLANEAGYADVRNSPNSVTFMSLSYVFAETVNQAGHVDDMSVCIVVLHTFVVIILYFGAAYVQSFPAETTAWFLLNFRNLFIFSKDVTRVAEFLSYSSTRPTRRDSTQLESKYLTLPATRLDSSRGSR